MHAMNNLDIYLINLKKRVDRYEHSIKMLNRTNLAKFIRKLDAYSSFKDDTLSIRENARVNCALSHFHCISDALKNNSQNTLILEDDCSPTEVTSVIPSLNYSMQELPQDWDMLFLGGNLYYDNNKPPVQPYSKNLHRLNYCVAMHSIIYNKCGLEKVYQKISQIENMRNWILKYEAIDVWYGKVLIPDLKCFIVKKHIFSQKPFFSDIENKVVDYQFELKNKMDIWNRILDSK